MGLHFLGDNIALGLGECMGGFRVSGSVLGLVAEWIHFTVFGDRITHYKTKSVHFGGL